MTVVERRTKVPDHFDAEHFTPSEVTAARHAVGQWGYGWARGRWYSSAREGSVFVPKPGARVWVTRAEAAEDATLHGEAVE